MVGLPHTPTCQVVQLPEWPGACVQAKDFVNQQVGHAEKVKYEEMKEDNMQTWDRGLVECMGPGGKARWNMGMSCSTTTPSNPAKDCSPLPSDYQYLSAGDDRCRILRCVTQHELVGLRRPDSLYSVIATPDRGWPNQSDLNVRECLADLW